MPGGRLPVLGGELDKLGGPTVPKKGFNLDDGYSSEWYFLPHPCLPCRLSGLCSASLSRCNTTIKFLLNSTYTLFIEQFYLFSNLSFRKEQKQSF